jgi:hypothetical protein
MKKFLFSLIFLLVSYVGFSQKGLSYQAVILDPNKIEVPGQDISGQPLVNGEVWMKFSIYNGSALQFEEVHKTQTDAYGLVNLLIGSVSATSFNSLVWDSSQKSLYVYVSFDQGGSYTKISDQKLNYNPYALFAETAGKLSGVLAIGNGGTGATTLANARTNLGIAFVDNTADLDKPISTSAQAALDLKANASDVTAALAAKADTASIKAFVRTQVATATISDADASTKGKIQLAGDLAGTADAPTVPGLALKANATDVSSLTTTVDANTASITANISDIALKAPIASPTFTGTVSGITKSMVGLGSVDNTTDAAKPISAATQTALDLKANSADMTTLNTTVNANTASITANTSDIALKANTTDVNTALALKANATDVTTALALKATAADLTTLTTSVNANTASITANAADLATLTTTVNTNTASITANTSDIALKANTTDVNTALALKAPLASPALSGVPTAPTASAGTNSTQIATTEFTNAAISSALSSTMFSVSTTLTSTITNPLGFIPSDNINYSGPLNVSTAQNLANGVDVLKGNQSGVANVGFGIANLFSNTTGTANTSVGYKGLYSNLSGKGNSAYGTYSLFNNTTGSSNTANGGQSLFSNTTGFGNTASGKFALFSNTAGTLNTATGYQALYTNTGNLNTAIGSYSLYKNTTGASNTATGLNSLFSNTQGGNNTANGSDALYSNTTGNGNTANGSYSLYSNTTANDNTANGYFSLYWNTTGQKNTASGGNSLKKNTTGSYNTANGYNSLQENTTGESNTSIGSFSLERNSTGSNNIAVGYYSLSNNTTAGSNTAIGNQSLFTNSTGEQNTANGYKSLRLNTGSYNTANGTYSLEGNETGTYNTAIGQSAGSFIANGQTPNTTSDYSVYLGSNTKASADDAQNEIVIGYNAIGGGSNTVTLGNTSVTKVITSGAITTGTVTYPKTHGTDGQVLSTTGSGTLTWTTLTHYIGESYGGGIVFYVYDNGKHGLIAATSDQSSSIKWHGGSDKNTRARANGVGAGLKNTAIIIANQAVDNDNAFAATVCNEYSVAVDGVTYGDWYLPSRHELVLMFNAKNHIPNLSNSEYWSSTEQSYQTAYLLDFSYGSNAYTGKDQSRRVRAIRAF